jgi:hypothetical protein
VLCVMERMVEWLVVDVRVLRNINSRSNGRTQTTTKQNQQAMQTVTRALEVCVHNILYERDVYPADSFDRLKFLDVAGSSPHKHSFFLSLLPRARVRTSSLTLLLLTNTQCTCPSTSICARTSAT